MPKEVSKFIELVVKQGNQLKSPIQFTVDSNAGIEHQYGDTECGMYSLFFIIHMLEDKVNENYMKTHILPDDFIQKYRYVFYNE